MQSSSSMSPNGNAVFKVGPQPVLNNSKSHKHGKQITFRTDQRQFRQGLHNVSTEQKQVSATSASNPFSQKIKVRFADPKTQVGFTPKQFNPDQPPAKRQRVNKYGPNNKERGFSVRRPLKISIPLDAWQLIFERCELEFLMTARMVCRGFRDILSRQAIWRKARAYCHGHNIPSPPKGFTEFQYANLLRGRGCQIEPCTRRDTRKVYWPFLLRMCDTCFERMTQVPSLHCDEALSYSIMYHDLEYEVQRTIPAHLSGLLPAGRSTSSRWRGSRPLDIEQRNWLDQSASATTLVLADAYEALRLEFSEKVENDPDYFLFWARLKWGETRDKMCKVYELEGIELGESSRPYDLREQKIVLFRKEASRLDPPMKFEVLQKFAAFHNAIDTPNAASLRSWDALKTKIDVPELRAQAEQLVHWDQRALAWERGTTPERDLYNRLYLHRNSGRSLEPEEYTPEQKVIIEIAFDEFEDIFDVVHDEDVLLLWFDRVRRAYELLDEKPIGLNSDGTEGPYNLMLDDALMLLRDILRPFIHNMDLFDRYKKVLTSLRCMGCNRTTPATTYDFQELMEHIRYTHARYVSKDSHWYRISVPTKPGWRGRNRSVAYFGLPWFKTMPALPFHRKPTPEMIWDPDVETVYVQHGDTELTHATFEVVVNDQTSASASIEDFASNFCRVVKALAETRLTSLLVIKLALEYATRVNILHCAAGEAPVKLRAAQLEFLGTMCATAGTRLEFKFQCKECAKEIEETPERQRPARVRKLSELITHWYKKHPTDEAPCVTEQIVLPTDSDFMKTMKKEDAKLEGEMKSALRKKARKEKLIDPRTAALLATPSIRSRFDQFFMPRANGEDPTQKEIDSR